MGLRRWCALGLLAVLATSAGTTAAMAAPAPSPLTIDVEGGWAGTFDPGNHVPVRVRVTADRLARGEIEVRVDDGQSGGVSVVVPVEVPGGSTKEYVVALPTTVDPVGLNLLATFRADGRELGNGTGTVQPTADVEVVGLLPGALGGGSLPGPAPLAIDAGTARFAEVRPEELAVPASLGGLDVIAAARGELAGLDETASGAVMAWLAGGGTLLVDEAPGEQVPGVPDEWQPGADGRNAAATGQVRAVDGAVSGGRWAGLVEPTPLDRAGLAEFMEGQSVDQDLAVDAGLKLPELNWLVGFLLFYVLGAVPVTLTVLRRTGRAEWGWVAVPLIAVVFTGVGYGAGRGLRSDVNLSHASTIYTDPGGAVASVSVGVVSSGGGDVATGFPRGWAPITSEDWMGGNVGSVAAVLTNDGTELRQSLQPGQFATHAARGPLDVEGRLDVVVQSVVGETVTGIVRNTLPFDLEEVAVFQGKAATNIGAVEAGAEVSFELVRQAEGDPWESPAARIWNQEQFFDGSGSDELVSMAQWQEVVRRAPSGSAATGVISVNGWTRDYRPPVAGDAEMKGRTLVIGSGPIVTPDAGFHAASTRTAKVRTPVGGPDESIPLVLRYVLPDGEGGNGPVDTGGLVVRAQEAGLALEVWVDGAWSALDTAAARPAGTTGPTGTAFADFPLPPGAAQNGVVWVRTPLDQSFSDQTYASSLELITLEAGQ